ncbi:alpha/beta hydrolase [Hymenobacter sp. BRD128]|uniref:alpha/beta hydrolase n=1 Tax=Hymenobacter sp. BRD128 TaxID=2675878 RepID=UPI00156443C7|nr:alpha/beta hydrolase-fold protein [Hymenobacter sp. BRD128]QKG55903.1 alpha/beta hydrolase [Hymenobacter sp. BRD128]
MSKFAKAALPLLGAFLLVPALAQTTLRLTAVPAATPADQPIYVSGTFTNWDPSAAGFALARQADGSYQLTLPATVSGAQEFKFTRGSWATSEADASFQAVANRRAEFGASPATLTFQVASWQDQRPGGTAPAGPKPHTLASNVHILTDSFRLPQLGGRARRVWLYLPPGYAAARRKRYPVLYLQDGQNVFDEATSFSGEWGVDETLNQLAAAGERNAECIVVAIDNDGAHRLDEYSPWANAEYKKGGEGDQYTNFLALTLKPYIDAHYRTRPDAAHTAIAGASMGGLIALYAGLKYPMLFGRVGVFSPAIWFAKDSMLAYERRRPVPLASRFYFVAGPGESETMLPLMTEARNGLLAKGVQPNHIEFKAPADGKHAEWFWRREFGPAYRWLLAE